MSSVYLLRDFVKSKTIREKEKLEIGVSFKHQASCFGGIFLLCCYCLFKEKKWIEGGWVLSGQSNFSQFFIIFLT